MNNKEEAELLHKHQTGLEKKQKAFAGTVQQLDYKVHKLEGDQLASIRFAEAVEKGLWQAKDEKKFLQKELRELSEETRREAEEKAKAQALANVHEKSCQEQQRQYEGKCEELAAAVEGQQLALGVEERHPQARREGQADVPQFDAHEAASARAVRRRQDAPDRQRVADRGVPGGDAGLPALRADVEGGRAGQGEEERRSRVRYGAPSSSRARRPRAAFSPDLLKSQS